MRINAIVIFWFLAIGGIVYIYIQMMGLSRTHFFGSTEAQEIQIRPEFDGRIKEIYVSAGQTISKGDTLLVLEVLEFDKRKSELSQQQSLANVMNHLEKTTGLQDKKILESEYNFKITELKSSLNELNQQMKIQSELKNSVSGLLNNHQAENSNLLQTEKQGIEQQIRDLELERNNKLVALDQSIIKKSGSYKASLDFQNLELNYLQQKFQNRYMTASIDGIIGEFYFNPGDFIDSRSVIFNITSLMPSKVKGFLPESSEMIPQIGERVALYSSYRPNVLDSGTVVYVYPKISELPFRLRKVPELRAYGRELYISLSDNNPFYIGEKLRIDFIPKYDE